VLAEIDALIVLNEMPRSHDDPFALDHACHTMGDDELDLLVIKMPAAPGGTCSLHDSHRERMMAVVLFDRSREADQVVGTKSRIESDRIHHLQRPGRQRAGLVEEKGVGFRKAF
jgi:hypothetical protein